MRPQCAACRASCAARHASHAPCGGRAPCGARAHRGGGVDQRQRFGSLCICKAGCGVAYCNDAANDTERKHHERHDQHRGRGPDHAANARHRAAGHARARLAPAAGEAPGRRLRLHALRRSRSHHGRGRPAGRGAEASAQCAGGQLRCYACMLSPAAGGTAVGVHAGRDRGLILPRAGPPVQPPAATRLRGGACLAPLQDENAGVERGVTRHKPSDACRLRRSKFPRWSVAGAPTARRPYAARGGHAGRPGRPARRARCAGQAAQRRGCSAARRAGRAARR